MTRRICVVTGTRAEYGLLRWVMEGIRDDARLELQIVATGMHLSPTFGLTYREIEADGFTIDRRVDMRLESDTPAGLARSMGLGVSGCGEAFEELRPDIVLVLGDRFEILAAVAATTVARIPVAHVHGGETSEGAFDEGIRHAVTKMSHLHFVAAEAYRRRVVQMGEHPARVFVVGGLGVDAILRSKIIERAELEARLGVPFGHKSLLITFHPVTLEDDTAVSQMRELLAALEEQSDTTLLFTMPNADTGGRALMDMVTSYVATHPNARAFTSLGHESYLSCLRQVDAVVGNSSSGLTEAPTFRTATINIGDRQRGRLKAESVIDCAPDRASIAAAFRRLASPAFQSALATAGNPYGCGGASERIIETLRQYPTEGILKKKFYDLPQ